MLAWMLFFYPGMIKGQDDNKFSFSHPQMGTEFRLVCYVADSLSARQAAKAAFCRLDSLNQRLSDYLPDSELNRFAASAGSGKWVSLSEDLYLVLAQAKSIHRQSKGAFDVSIRPLSSLWRRAFGRQQIPDSARIVDTRDRVNARWIKLRSRERAGKLMRKEMQLDLGGIAKGYALDAMAQVLEKHGICRFLLEGGGDLLLGKAPPQKPGWEIGLPNGESDFFEQCAIATSGDTYQYLEVEGRRYSHLIDPRTGWGITHRQQVTVIAPTGTLADAWASAFSILNTAEGDRIRRKLKKKGILIKLITIKN